eukprot:CAMPEP_0182447410 /NCGR_PEP_ID=MMETSP1172-20130603/15770_1 /TAXON_ID=708627 /ORGANISM="Timspurckia oligopyrenoides, Strain CCMP3278" /LENGTH=196 /DNA_ID=CAMNT_0024643839 /DNA_START=122 /DNA_END=712 /DNA_ORIENTATION=-
MEAYGSRHQASVFKELRSLLKTPIDGIHLNFTEDSNLSDIRAVIDGPESTPYEGGSFEMKLVLNNIEYPNVPPKGYFMTKIFHPNVATSNGEICVNALKKDWNPKLGLKHVLLVIRCLLIDPNAESALNEEAGKLLLQDYEEFSRIAKVWTDVYSVKRIKSDEIVMDQKELIDQNDIQSGNAKNEKKKKNKSLKRL